MPPMGKGFRCASASSRPSASCTALRRHRGDDGLLLRAFVVQGGSAKKSASPEELGSADPGPEEGDPPLLRAAEISGGARPQPRKGAACTIRQEAALHGAGVECVAEGEVKEFFKGLSGKGTPDKTKPVPAKMLGPETPALVMRSGTT